MARTEDDSWDLASSVGATATGVAVGRALASRGEDPLIDDPFAEPLVRAVGVDFFTRLATGELDPASVDDGIEFGMARMRDMMAVRTRFFDDFFMQSVRNGIRQVVILASGLDARAYRLPWPHGTVVFEIDQPKVLDFKAKALNDMGAISIADRRAVPVDLRHDWPTALRSAGFDPTRPVAWSAEGLLPFLPPEAQDQLLDNITELSAAGSRLASENVANAAQTVTALQTRMKEAIDSWRRHGFDIDMDDLWYAGNRNDVVDFLSARGWHTTGARVAELIAAQDLPLNVDTDETDPLNVMGYVTATRM
ncbi:class I SAM-dependent methyltransferase [Mycobacterium sp. DBP42]|uniref:class I SAM-dependent methyltransferase n=1 Tax=Mycobacterium sp. DBP42 TaxID=2545267 RepID=UPI00110CBB45|nr:class I SAM-dependent methyltransferase [Mycobacterium sp. DBP42]TMS51148.1 class I SAM-dependent methyltransferase [Mycobacterium sp. DBP42]